MAIEIEQQYDQKRKLNKLRNNEGKPLTTAKYLKKKLKERKEKIHY